MQTESPKKSVVSKDNEEIGRLLSRLGRVDAPPDFQSTVRARIASRRASVKSARRGWLVPVTIAGAACLALLIWVSGAFREDSSSNMTALPAATNSVTITSGPKASPTAAEELIEDSPVRNNPKKVIRNADSRRPTERNERRSVDFALKQAQPGPPRGAADPTVAGQPFQTPATITITSVLADLGIKTTVSGRRLIVTSVRENSVADRSGIKVGDSIEAIDTRPVDSTTVFERTASGGTFTVARNGRLLEIRLQ